MATIIGDGKVTFNGSSITIKKAFGSDVIQKRHIKKVAKQGGIFYAIWWTIWVITIYKAIRMYMGQSLVSIQTSEKVYSFWLPNSEYGKFKENL